MKVNDSRSLLHLFPFARVRVIIFVVVCVGSIDLCTHIDTPNRVVCVYLTVTQLLDDNNNRGSITKNLYSFEPNDSHAVHQLGVFIVYHSVVALSIACQKITPQQQVPARAVVGYQLTSHNLLRNWETQIENRTANYELCVVSLPSLLLLFLFSVCCVLLQMIEK